MTDHADSPERASSLAPTAPSPTALVPLRSRHDGWTPEKQRDFIEHLADTGCAKEAAARVGMSESSAYRLRRRSDAEGFDAAWEAALEKGLQRLTSMAFERAINGTVKRIWYHGELVAEERVYSERLLLWLLSHGRDALGRSKERRKLTQDWDGAMEALGAAPVTGQPPEGFRVWRDAGGTWLTSYPPPPAFFGYEEKEFGQPGYCRTLTDEERSAAEGQEAATHAEAHAARVRHFGAAKARARRR